MDRRRLMNEIVSGGGMEMTDLPLLYECTLTERELQHNTGKIFRCDKRIVVEVIIPKDTPIGAKGSLMVGCHQENNNIQYAFQSNLIDNGYNAELEQQHGVHLFIDAFKLKGSQWVSRINSGSVVNAGKNSYSTLINSNYQPAKEAILGLIIGNSASGGDKTMAIGTTIKVWGI